jgi:hypothetical protein
MTFELLNELILSTVEQSAYRAVRYSSQIGFVNKALTTALFWKSAVLIYSPGSYHDGYIYVVESL